MYSNSTGIDNNSTCRDTNSYKLMGNKAHGQDVTHKHKR